MQLLVPFEKEISITELATMTKGPTFAPFSTEVMTLCMQIAEHLFADSKALEFPELQALAFFMRKSALTQLKSQFDELKSNNCLLCPRGLVFHIPPSNVDSIFVYSWLLSALCGNRNILRISSRHAEQTEILLNALRICLKKSSKDLANSTLIVSYGHENEITEAISQLSDMRVIWGGDQTVSSIRRAQLPPHAKEITFADRYSLSAISAKSYLALDEKSRSELAKNFYNDTFWFDQLGCSSPRLIIWLGKTTETDAASEHFWIELKGEVDKHNYSLPTGAVLSKMAAGFQAVIDQPVVHHKQLGNEINILDLDSMAEISRNHPGMGLFYQYRADNLSELSTYFKRKDQTLTYFGIGRDEILSLVSSLNGQAIDRLVPIGQALAFNRYWDGYDLLREFTKCVYVEA